VTVAVFKVLAFHLLFCHMYGCLFEKVHSPGYLLTLLVVWLDCLQLVPFVVEIMSGS
jgi:hypothetical protein